MYPTINIVFNFDQKKNYYGMHRAASRLLIVHHGLRFLLDVRKVHIASAGEPESGEARKRVEQARRMAVAGKKLSIRLSASCCRHAI